MGQGLPRIPSISKSIGRMALGVAPLRNVIESSFRAGISGVDGCFTSREMGAPIVKTSSLSEKMDGAADVVLVSGHWCQPRTKTCGKIENLFAISIPSMERTAHPVMT